LELPLICPFQTSGTGFHLIQLITKVLDALQEYAQVAHDAEFLQACCSPSEDSAEKAAKLEAI
jgi:hypothetical protein